MRHRLLASIAALCFAATATAFGQGQDNATDPASTQPAAAHASPAPSSNKKVWTNDDVSDLRDSSQISTVGQATAKSGKTGQAAASSKNKDSNWYRSQITKLQGQLPPLDAQIAQLRATINGTAQGDTKSSSRPTGVKGGDWQTELGELQTKRDGIVAQIAALEDEARHNGIPPNALP